MRPVLSYYGGKQQMTRHILPLLPNHHHYIEPFCGGAALFFAKGMPKEGPSGYTETLNDINFNIISMYRELQDKDTREALFERIRYTPSSLIEWQLARAIYSNPDKDIPRQERAWATMVLYTMSFSSIGRSWGWAKGEDARINLRWRNRTKMICDELHDRLDYVQLDCRDAFEVIKKYDCPGALFYCDPPYPSTQTGMYEGCFTENDLLRLVQLLDQCKASVVLSCYDTDIIPASWVKHEFATRANTISSRFPGDTERTGRIECLWIKDRGWKSTRKKSGGSKSIKKNEQNAKVHQKSLF